MSGLVYNVVRRASSVLPRVLRIWSCPPRAARKVDNERDTYADVVSSRPLYPEELRVT